MDSENRSEHFQPYENQDESETFLQMMETMQDILNQKEQGSQPQDSKNIWSEYDESILGNGKNRRNGINRENDVSSFH